MSDPLSAAIATIRDLGAERAPEVAFVLGSGLAGLAAAVDDGLVIPTEDIAGFPGVKVEGHSGDLVLGRLGGCEVAILKGRTHYYETGRADGMKTFRLRVLHGARLRGPRPDQRRGQPAPRSGAGQPRC